MVGKIIELQRAQREIKGAAGDAVNKAERAQTSFANKACHRVVVIAAISRALDQPLTLNITKNNLVKRHQIILGIQHYHNLRVITCPK